MAVRNPPTATTLPAPTRLQWSGPAVAPLYYQVFISGEPVDEAVADQATAAAVAAG